MQMTNAELAELLNVRLGLTGRDAVTGNVVRQWIAWDVLPKATAQGRAIGKGPIWSRSGAALRRGLRLGALRKGGIKRENALIIQAYIEWGHPDFERVRDALLNEWPKWATQLTRRQTTFLDNADFRNISATKKRAIATQLGPIDSIFQGTQFEQSSEFYAVISEIARSDAINPEYAADLMAKALRQALPGVAETLPAYSISALVGAFAGMTGTPDEIENSAENAIRNASERQFRIARYQIRLFFRNLPKIDQPKQSDTLYSGALQLSQMLKFLSPQISTGPWLIFLFIQALKNTFPKQEN